MAIQLSVTVRNNRLDQIEATVGASAKLYVRSGAQPANCAAADSGILLATLTLPADWMSDAAAGVKALLGVWSAVAGAAGIAAHFRIKDSAGAACGLQGSITATGGGGDMELDNTNIAIGQTVSVTTFSLTDANA